MDDEMVSAEEARVSLLVAERTGQGAEILARLARTVVALHAEVAQLRASVDGRTTPSTDDELAAHADLMGADLTRAVLMGADLRCVNLRCVNLRDADLTRANLRGAILAGAILAGVNLRDADLTRANLRGAILAGADLMDVNLTGADLSGAWRRITDPPVPGWTLRDGVLTREGGE